MCVTCLLSPVYDTQEIRYVIKNNKSSVVTGQCFGPTVESDLR